MSVPRSPILTLLVYLGWLLLSALAAVALWYLYSALMVLVALWLSGDLPRPPGWSTLSLVGISRVLILTLGSGWLIGILYMERDLSRRRRQGESTRRLLLYGALFAGIWGLAYGIVFLGT